MFRGKTKRLFYIFNCIFNYSPGDMRSSDSSCRNKFSTSQCQLQPNQIRSPNFNWSAGRRQKLDNGKKEADNGTSVQNFFFRVPFELIPYGCYGSLSTCVNCGQHEACCTAQNKSCVERWNREVSSPLWRMKSRACARRTRLSGFASWAFIKKSRRVKLGASRREMI